ncbi:hypothetical protein MUK42_18539 [Musa troglodytarum]|uniref:PGG domain-containing protein n=1 Tax=Musa troglodytarum TaxID=320322 RepID=A0A9E7HBM7_9LILI|nr:hypothetical protein MUK42_18539 [Musa troglodytarum]
MSAELVANDGSSVVLSLSPNSKDIQAVRFTLGPTMVELKAMHGPDGSTSLDVLLGQHRNPNPTVHASTSSTTLLPHEANVAAAAGEQKVGGEWMKEMRGWLMLLASLFANMTFQAGLNPPDGFWQDSSVTSPLSSPSQAPVPTPSATGYAVSGVQQKAGYPVLYETHRWRSIFFWSNTVAFAYSMIMLHRSDRLRRRFCSP